MLSGRWKTTPKQQEAIDITVLLRTACRFCIEDAGVDASFFVQGVVLRKRVFVDISTCFDPWSDGGVGVRKLSLNQAAAVLILQPFANQILQG